jgi:hypothetical protein
VFAGCLLNYRGFDGVLYTASASMKVDIASVADAATLTLSNGPALSRELFRTGFESATNSNTTSTNLQQTTFEGWTRIDTPNTQSGGSNGFEIWSTGDLQENALNTSITVAAMAGNGTDFLELNDASGSLAQTIGISRAVTTVAGASYTLSFDYAGRPGFAANFTRIGVYVDGTKLATIANTSPSNSLSWQTMTYNFIGTGGSQTVKLISEATQFNAGGRGAMVDDIALVETRQYNSTAVGGAANLQTITAGLADTDGSETLVLEIRNLAAGLVLSDGTRSFTATATSTTAVITGWTLNALTLKPPTTYQGTLTLQVVAISTEANSTGLSSTSIASQTLSIDVHAPTLASPIIIDLNGDGVKTISLNLMATQLKAQAGFDLLNNGTKVNSGWIDQQDGFLAWDKNGNGSIDSRAELFGGSQGEGYAQLQALDTNGDGVLDQDDEGFKRLSIWQDKNSNQITDEGELQYQGGMAER